MNIPYCKEHRTTRRYVVPGCPTCKAEQRVLLLIAQNGNRPLVLEDGDVCMVWLRDEGRAMMARVFPDGGRVRLMPINLSLPPVFKQPCEIEIRGRVLKTISVKHPVGNWPTG